MANPKYFRNRCGVLKIFTIIVGVISIGFTAFSCDQEWKEEVYLGIAITCWVISLLYLIFHFAVTDIELKRSNKALDSGYHFVAGLFLLCGGILMVYSAVDLNYDIWYFCTYGIDRGIPCFFNKRGSTAIVPYPSNNGGLPAIPTPTYNSYGTVKSLTRSFFHPKWFSWLGGGHEICYDILPRVLDCNRYFGLKLAGGILGIFNAIMYGVTGILVILSN